MEPGAGTGDPGADETVVFPVEDDERPDAFGRGGGDAGAAAGEPLAGEAGVGGAGGRVAGDPHPSILPRASRTSCRQAWSGSRRPRQRSASLGVLPPVRLRSQERRPSAPG